MLIGRYLMYIKIIVEWIVGRLVMKCENNGGILCVRFVYMRLIFGICIRLRLGFSFNNYFIEILCCILYWYCFRVL